MLNEILNDFFLVPVNQLKLYSVLANGSDAKEYTNGEKVFFYEGETRYFRCMANGSSPEPELSIMIGEEDISDAFKTQSRMLIGGDLIRDAGLLVIQHQVPYKIIFSKFE